MDLRRDAVPFDSRAFEKAARDGENYSISETFARIHRAKHWTGSESVSGAGSGTAQTRVLSQILRDVVREFEIKTLLDAPCGDFGWMSAAQLPLESYCGADIVPDLIRENERRYGDERHRFECADITRDALPAADLMLCRDCLVHLSFADITRALRNVSAQPIQWLLTTTFPRQSENEEIVTGDWRPLNLQRAPFHLPPPLRLFNENCSEGDGKFADKSLGLWRVGDLKL